MEKSKVFFCDMHATPDMNLLDKLRKLILAAGIESIDFREKFTAIKIHFGEPGNLAYLRPNYAKVLVDLVKELGGKPFLTDANTLYVGGRKNALDHLDSAYENGFNPFATGCHILIADGLKGTDEVSVAVNGEYVTQAKIGRAVMDADIVLSLNHFKAHEATGIGGALKNLGMGCGSFAGKREMHADAKTQVDRDRCVGCGVCTKNCAHGAVTVVDGKASVDTGLCAGCARCIKACPTGAIHTSSEDSFDMLDKKIAEYALAVVAGRPHFHVSLVIDVSPYCDCHSENDVPLVPDVGMLASFDPVALDMACADLVNAQPVMPGCAIDGLADCKDRFKMMHPETNYIVCLDHAQKLGIGTKEYELIDIEA